MEAPQQSQQSQQPQLFHTQLFAQAVTTPAMISVHQAPLTPPPSVVDMAAASHPTVVKMEDISLNLPFATSPLPPTSHPSTPTPSEAKSGAKKRKSWGQVLPEPKTNLPPRKRAKTEDEKEQRRIERVKRNRLAAHNSRERKRQEVEELQLEKDRMEEQLQAANALVAKMSAQIKAFQQRHPEELFDLSFDSGFEASSPSNDLDSVPSQSDTVCPRQTSFPSPVSMDSMDSPRDDSCQPETPAYSEMVASEVDQTRYPAAILCDLQCRSTSQATSSASLQATLAYLILFNLTLPSLMTSLLTTSSHSMRSLTTTWTNLSAWWSQTSSQAPSSTPQPQTLMAFLIHLMQSPSTCRLPPAQQTLATRLSQRRSSFKWIARSSGRRGWTEIDGAQRRRSSRTLRLIQGGRRKDLLLLERNIQRALRSFREKPGALTES